MSAYKFIPKKQPEVEQKFPAIFSAGANVYLFCAPNLTDGYPWILLETARPENVGLTGSDEDSPYKTYGVNGLVSNDVEIEVKVK